MRFKLIFFLLLFSSLNLFSQNNLLDILNNQQPSTSFSKYIFKGTKIINSQSVEMPDNGVLQFMIQHRFGTLNSGFYNLFGLDNSQVRIGFDYGLNKFLSIGLGRSSSLKAIDSNLKIRIARQSKGKINFPFTMCFNSAIAIKQFLFSEIKNSDFLFANQFAYTNQFLIARKFSREFSLQISPTLVHYNLLPLNQINHDQFSIGYGARYKLNNRMSINVESFYQLNSENNINQLSFGFDIETGGHVFQLHMTNSAFMIDRAFIHETYDSWLEGDIYFGFNISRVFTLKDK